MRFLLSLAALALLLLWGALYVVETGREMLRRNPRAAISQPVYTEAELSAIYH